MGRISQLPYLVRLLDDDTPLVREAVLRELEEFGASLEDQLERLGISLSSEESRPIQHILERNRRKTLKASWSQWFAMEGDKRRLEAALRMIVEFQDGKASAAKLPLLLDRLAAEYRLAVPHGDALDLAAFLFREKGLRGVKREEYHDPRNSNLVSVLEQRQGLPISLACTYILVGSRLGFSIEGCNFPGHFLAVVRSEHGKVLVDCFNGGRSITQEDLAGIDAKVSMKDILRLECRSAAIIARVVRNLKSAYERSKENTQLMDSLLQMMNTNESLSPLH
jgi:regulator of sirC expression with transglutaminase-like and TPR domain